MTNDTVLVEQNDGVATLTLNRPGVLNALTNEMAEALAERTGALGEDREVRCVVICGAGGHFMAGGDIQYFNESLSLAPKIRQETIRAVIARVHEAIEHIRAMPKPVVASVRGACAGFGLSLMASCDLALVTEDAVLSLAYSRIGATPDGGSTFALPRLIGTRRAMELALLGERFSASKALDFGLVNRVVAPDELDAHTQELARRLADGPLRAYGETKRLINTSLDSTLSEQLAAEERCFLDGVAMSEFEEGVRAFCAKRKPKFRG